MTNTTTHLRESSIPPHQRSESIRTTTSSRSKRSTYTLHDILGNPKLLRAFEKFLRTTWSQENLFFIESMTQLRHEHDPKVLESSLHRIFKTFLVKGAPYELNVTTQEDVKNRIQSLQWAIVTRTEAVNTLRETEIQVLDMLKLKLDEFVKLQLPIGPVNNPQPRKEQLRVVIIGGGFCGFTVASILDAMPLFHVTLIDTKESFEYTPGAVKKLVNPHQSTSLRVRHDAYVRNGRVIIGYADDIGHDGTSVVVNEEEIFFDYMVMASGSSYASSLKSTDVSTIYRLNGLEQIYEELIRAQKVLIIGGGLVGCELASEIAQRTFPGAYPKKHITLLDSNSSIVGRSNEVQQERAMHYLLDLGVEVVCNERIIDFDTAENNVYVSTSGRVYRDYDKVFMATGTRPNSQLFLNSTNEAPLDGCLDAWGRIRVKPTLQIDHYKYQHIFAGGDVTNVIEEKTGYAATIAGVCIARNICRMVKGKAPLQQGKGGTLPAPDKPLHGILSNGGIGKEKLSGLKKRFSFLNPAWAALKYFDEQQFMRIVQGEAPISAHVLGRLPRRLNVRPTESPLSVERKAVQISGSRSKISHHHSSSSSSDLESHHENCPCKEMPGLEDNGSDSNSSLEGFLMDHLTLNDERYQFYEHNQIHFDTEKPRHSEKTRRRRRSTVSTPSGVCGNTSSRCNLQPSMSSSAIHTRG
ncbi:uncharacterized protein BYT42DRAFT_580683 [Radiomyces spectabilis]|uniref:uncharacterized protein n=1 Tax=Radiomyces spectabilis TaxID=64574 RepID=UPI002220118F|nr:uncharacterized protein BYT42DRAFT_580683 [Radiomyces spectabilis]KAI8371556.1 hypothetical protein BYT42DRAFT_580683 [Radiomyces spectabilis]